MSELKWNWVYYPYLDAPNKQEESALKAGYIKVVIKDEADKVFAELEEKLKNSRNARKYWRKEYLIEYKECCYQKYKRCLAMSKWCKSEMVRYINSCDRYDISYINKKSGHYNKWLYKWMELAEKFKETK